MRIHENGGDSIKNWARAMGRLAREIEDDLAHEFEEELNQAYYGVREQIHEHTGVLKATFDQDTQRRGGHWEGQLHTGDNPDAARAAHFEKERGGDHDFTRSLSDDTYFGERFENKLHNVFEDKLARIKKKKEA